MDRYAACNETLALAAQPGLWTPGATDLFELFIGRPWIWLIMT